MNSILQQISLGELNFPVECSLIFPRTRRTKLPSFCIGFAFLTDADFKDFDELMSCTRCIFVELLGSYLRVAVLLMLLRSPLWHRFLLSLLVMSRFINNEFLLGPFIPIWIFIAM